MSERKARMTDRERIEALFRREKPDRVPIWIASYGYSMLHVGASIAEYYNNPQVSLDAQRQTCRDYGWVFMPFAGGIIGAWEFGGEQKWPSGEFEQSPTVTRRPIENEEDAWNLKMPDVKHTGAIPIRMEFSKLSSKESFDNEPFNVVLLSGWPFTVAAELPGPEKFIKWLIKSPEVAHHLLRLSTDYQLELIKYWVDTFGTSSMLTLGGEATSANQLIPAEMFETYNMPYLQEMNQKILAMGCKHILCHICGEHNANLPYWAKVPMGDPGIISIGHEIKLETAAEYFPNDIILGNLEPRIVQTGTPDEVYEATRKNVEDGKKLPTGYIFSVGCELPPKSPPENVMAMTKAVNDFGWY